MFKRIIPSAIAIGCGLIVLAGLLLPVNFLSAPRRFLVEWAMVLGVFAFILAYLNVMRVHLARVTESPKERLTSLVVIVTSLMGCGVVLFGGLGGAPARYMMTYVMIPGESALLALTAVTLLLAGMRVLQQRRSFGSVLFILAAIVTLLLSVPYSGVGLVFVDTIRSIVQIPALAGMRGLLMGSALGIGLTGLRIIFGTDRPHSDG